MLTKTIRLIFKPRILISFLGLLISRIFSLLRSNSKAQIEIALNSEVFMVGNVRTKIDTRFRERWTHATWLSKSGRYHEAVTRRKEVILDSRLFIGAEENFTPLILESDFISHYGHLSMLAYLKSGITLGILPQRELMIITNSNKLSDRPILRMALAEIQTLNPKSTESIFNTDTLFALSEKTVMLSQANGFLDMQELINRVEEVGGPNISGLFSAHIHESEKVEFEEELSPFLNEGYSWFAAIHIRNSSGKDSSRNSSVDSLFELISYINSKGGFAILIGDNSRSVLSGNGLRYLDLRTVSRERKFLVDLAISKAKFFIGPDSGPSALAVMFGIPTLRLDGVACMKNTYSTHGPSVSLPKYWLDSGGKRVHTEKVFESELGFCEDDSLAPGFRMMNNSQRDALESFKLLENISGSGDQPSSSLGQLSKRKVESGGIGSGLISPYFLER